MEYLVPITRSLGDVVSQILVQFGGRSAIRFAAATIVLPSTASAVVLSAIAVSARSAASTITSTIVGIATIVIARSAVVIIIVAASTFVVSTALPVLGPVAVFFFIVDFPLGVSDITIFGYISIPVIIVATTMIVVVIVTVIVVVVVASTWRASITSVSAHLNYLKITNIIIPNIGGRLNELYTKVKDLRLIFSFIKLSILNHGSLKKIDIFLTK